MADDDTADDFTPPTFGAEALRGLFDELYGPLPPDADGVDGDEQAFAE